MRVKILTYNIHIGVPCGHNFGNYITSIKNLENIADVIKSSGAEIIGLNEVDRYYCSTATSRSGNLHESKELGRLTGMNYAYGSTRDDGPYPGPGMTDFIEWGNESEIHQSRPPLGGAYGNAQLSRHSFQAVFNFKLPNNPENEQRCMLMTEQIIDGKTVHIYNVHIQHSLVPSYVVDRWHQIHRIAEILKADHCKYKLLMGDFNWDSEYPAILEQDVPEKEIFPVLENIGMVDTVKSFTPQPPKTYPADNPVERLDYLFTTPNIKVMGFKVLETLVSDHRPLFVEAKLS